MYTNQPKIEHYIYYDYIMFSFLGCLSACKFVFVSSCLKCLALST